MNSQIKVLDHGYILHIESWGKGQAGQPEAGMIEAARQSTQGNFKGWGPVHQSDCAIYHIKPDRSLENPKHFSCDCSPAQGDEKLLKYLYSNKHATPFEFAGMIIEVQAPIFVFREWHRHRTQSYNEMSARYAPMPNTHYIPTVERLMMKSDANKQAGAVAGSEVLTVEHAEYFRRRLAIVYEDSEIAYQEGLDLGVPKELARLPVSVARYSRMRASANLRNWLAFLTLRMDPAAQWEIRQYANAVAEVVAQEFPQTWVLFEAGRK